VNRLTSPPQPSAAEPHHEISLAREPKVIDIASGDHMTDMADKIIVALDVATAKEALELAERLRARVSRFKVGLQLYTAAGPEIVRQLKQTGAKIFLDLKLHDIPNTVAGAVQSARSLGVDMLTVHLAGGEAMVRTAVETAQGDIMILGVTVLTSQTKDTLGSIGIPENVPNQVQRLASLGLKCGIGGLVASPQEAAMLRQSIPANIKIVTPGIRPDWSGSGDQKRVTTPRTAIQAGADYLVIGRPITADPDPCAAVERIVAEIEAR
jgi:orotidine-5'-phosphate decarboxylase